MIASLSGQVSHRDLNWVILEVSGVGYQVWVPKQVVASVGSQLRLFCSQQVREDSLTLYGFATLAERAWFELLLSVSGVGPKSALAILGLGALDRIEEAIRAGDPTLFATIPGIGKKVAAKIIVELKGKLDRTGSLLPSPDGLNEDVMAALEALGYRPAEIGLAIRDLPKDLSDTQAKIRWALRHLARS